MFDKEVIVVMGNSQQEKEFEVKRLEETISLAREQLGQAKAAAEEKAKLSKVLGSVQGRQAQDRQAEEDILSYVTHGAKMGIEDPQSLVYFADLENQGGAGASKRVGNAAAQKARSEERRVGKECM